jgi:lysophospholipase L1-like esterase
MRRIVAALAVVAAALTLTAAVAGAQPPSNPWDPKRVLIMGSSTTGCVGPVDSAGQPDPSQCYVNLVKASRQNDTVTVLAKGGSYVAYGPAAQNWTTTTIPGGNDIVIIQLGVNDWYVPVAPATYRTQLDSLLDRVVAANPAAEIHWIRTWMPTPTGNADTRRSMWVQHGYVTADAVEAVGGQFHDMAGTPGPFAADATGWHYNGGAHQRMARVVLDFM